MCCVLRCGCAHVSASMSLCMRARACVCASCVCVPTCGHVRSCVRAFSHKLLSSACFSQRSSAYPHTCELVRMFVFTCSSVRKCLSAVVRTQECAGFAYPCAQAQSSACTCVCAHTLRRVHVSQCARKCVCLWEKWVVCVSVCLHLQFRVLYISACVLVCIVHFCVCLGMRSAPFTQITCNIDVRRAMC